jgi:ubiquitin thioesterase protein OTUB1
MSAPQHQTSTDNAATQDPPPRIIDENTDMSTLTDQEIMRLMEGMDHNEDVMSKVRLSSPLSPVPRSMEAHDFSR